MDVKVNNHKSWLGLSTLEASSNVTRLGGWGLWSLPNVHRAYSECVLWSRVPFLTQPLGANLCACTPASRQLCLAVERGYGTDKEQEFGTDGRAWVTTSPMRFCMHTIFLRGRSGFFRQQQCQAVGAWLGSSEVLTCCVAVLHGCLASRVQISSTVWHGVGRQAALRPWEQLPLGAVWL